LADRKPDIVLLLIDGVMLRVALTH
jgi:hypothetical protein